MAKMDKYEEMFEGLDLSDEFKRSFLMAKGIDVSEPEEVVATQEPSASLVNTPVQEKQQESVDETKTTTPIPTKVQPQTSESKVFYKDVTEKIEASLADEYENIVKEKNHLLSTYDPDLSISLKEDVNQFFNPTMAEPQKKSVENKPIKIKAQSMHKEMLGVENNKAIENVVEESTEIKPVEIEAEDNKVVENVIEENIETKDERVKVLKEFEQEKIEDQDLLLDDDLLDLDVDFAFDLDAELDEIDKLEKMLPKKDNSGVKEKVVIEKPDFSNRVENEDLKVYDNFYYLKDLNPSLYTKIKQTESTLIHDHVKTVQEFNGVIETFCKDVINADLNTICRKKVLGTSFNYERVISMNDANIVSLKDIETLNHQLKNNVSLDSKYTTLVNDKNVISGNVLRNGLKSLDVVLRAFYKVNDKKKWLKDSTKIDAYDIYKVTTTAPGCKKEYYGIDSSVTPNAYAVIKEYDVQNMDMNFVKRNMSVLERIHSNTMDPIEGIADIKQLNEVNTEDESYYVSYVFHKQPMELSQENLNRADTPFERVQMCKRLSNAISQLHNLEEPIYHRLINAKSVVLCDFSDKKFGIVPYLINFDFSKFKAADAKMTVLEQFKNEVDSLKQEDMEYICEYDMTDTSYEKMDIYALGILFIRILSGDLQSPRLDLADKLNLIEENYNSKIADLLEMMLSETAIDRPTAKQVYAVFMEAYSSVSSEKNDAIIVTPKELKENDDVLNGDVDLDFNYEEAMQDLSDNENTKESYIIPMDVEREEDDEIVEEEEVVSKKEKLDFSYHEPNTPIEIKDNFAYLKDGLTSNLVTLL
jgi:ribosomal protein L9